MVCLVLGMLLISRTNKGVLKSISENPPAATNDNPDVSRASVSTPVNADKSPPDFMAKVDVDQRRVIPQSTSPSITSGLRPPTEFSEPYIILRNGETVGKYAELPVNRPELREEDIIEIRGNGPYALPEILSDRGLHLRAAEGFHPVFIPDDSVLPNHHWIFVMKGTLRLEGCEFRRMKENDRELFGVWGDACEIVNCTLARGASNFQSLVECRCPIVRISDSLLIAGAGHVAFKLRSEVREISVENTIYLFDSYCAFSIDQSEVSRSFRLEHNTFVGIHFLFGGELFQKQIVRHRLQPLQLRVRHNVFANEADVFAPDYDNELTIDDFRSRLTWQGEGNIAPKFAHQSLLEAIAEPGQAGLTSVPQLQVQANQARGSSSASLRFDPQQWRLLSSDGTVHPSIGVDFSRYHRPPALQ